IDLINDIPADDLFLELYMLVKDKEFGNFVGRYQYVLEMAKEKPDIRSIHGKIRRSFVLHSSYTPM
ncbi:MAG: hypothetical protein IKH75_19870, partial [Ruminococcus sp.]|nr:hypothetical protein [Ruminococcus sp.]